MDTQWRWALALLGFVGLNVWAVATGGWSGLVGYLGNLGPYGVLASVDLIIALFIGTWWMWREARERGVSPWPYAFMTLLTGSVGLLAYLALRRGNGARSADGRSVAAPVSR